VASARSEHQDEAKSPYKASWLTQTLSLCRRNLSVTLKDPMVAKMKILQAFIIALILGTIYFGQENDQLGIQNLNGALFVLVTNMSFSNVFAVVNVFCVEIPIFLKEHLSGMYRVDAYFLAKQLVDLPLFIIDPLIVVSILYWMVGLNPDPVRFLTTCLLVLLVVQVVLSLGYFLSCSCPSVEVALAVGPILIIPAMLFGGFFLNSASVPSWLLWLKHLSWLYYGFEVLAVNQWEGVQGIECRLGDELANNTRACSQAGEEVLHNLGFKPADFWVDIVILIAMILVLRALAFIALVKKSRSK